MKFLDQRGLNRERKDTSIGSLFFEASLLLLLQGQRGRFRSLSQVCVCVCVSIDRPCKRSKLIYKLRLIDLSRTQSYQ
jgi:hypothetical protein